MPRLSRQNNSHVLQTGALDSGCRWTRRSSVSHPAEISQISELRYKGAELLRRCVSDPAYAALESDAKLLISEVATNAVIHGEAPTLTLTLATSAGAVRFCITGQRKALPSQQCRQRPQPTSESGRGLLLVAAVAAAWGADLENGVWFVLTIPEAVGDPAVLAS